MSPGWVMEALRGPAVWIELASAGRAHSRYGFSAEYLAKGRGLILEKLERFYAYGFRSAFLHRPDGEYPDGGPMNFDSRLGILHDRQSSALERRIVDLDATEAFLHDVRRRCPGMVLIPYLGSLRDRGMAERLLASGSVSGWLDRIVRSAGPWLNAPVCCLGIDAASAYEHEAGREGQAPAEWRVVQMLDAVLRRSGRLAVIEAFADPARAEQHAMAQVGAEWIWRGRVRGVWMEPADHWRAVKASPAVWRIWSGHSLNTPERPAGNDFGNDVLAWMSDCAATGTLPAIDEGVVGRELMPAYRTLGAAWSWARKRAGMESEGEEQEDGRRDAAGAGVKKLEG